MSIVSHIFEAPLVALESVARDGTARYMQRVVPVGHGVKVIFKLPTDVRGVLRLPLGERYGALVAKLNAKRKKVYYVGK